MWARGRRRSGMRGFWRRRGFRSSVLKKKVAVPGLTTERPATRGTYYFLMNRFVRFCACLDGPGGLVLSGSYGRRRPSLRDGLVGLGRLGKELLQQTRLHV